MRRLFSRGTHYVDCSKHLKWQGLIANIKRVGRCMHSSCIKEGIFRSGYYSDQCFYGCFCRERRQRARKLRRKQRLNERFGIPFEQSDFQMSEGEGTDDV